MMTDSEIKRVALQAVGDYYRSIPKGSPFDMEKCMDVELAAFKKAYNGKVGRWSVLTGEAVRDITRTFVRLRPELMELTQERIHSLKKSEKASAINAATAKAVLTGLLEDSGLTYRILCQKYRVKVCVDLPRKGAVLLVFYYSDFLGKDLSALASSLKYLEQAVSPARKKERRKAK